VNNWKIGTRVWAAFGVVILIAAALGLFSYSKLGVINDASVEITTNILPSVELITALKSTNQSAYGLILAHAMSSSEERG
jgi:CHASE3 domain sensor protein